MINVTELLEIIIPTFNRADTLQKTVETLLNSPVGNCKITILDNNSKDNTKEVVEAFQGQYENVKYIKNRYNYGLAGNICKALTLPTEKYFWIVFDDTGLDFSNWEYIEKGLKPVYWCASCETALAEAEVEYADHTSYKTLHRF